MAKTIKLFGFASIKPAKAVKKFVEGYTGKGTVYDVVEVGQKQGSRAYAIVEFTTMEAAELIVLWATEKRIWDGDSYLKACYLDRDSNSPKARTPQHRIDNARLNFGCQISEEKFSVLWSQENVSVKFDSDLRNFSFLLSYYSEDYKVEISYETIWQIELKRPGDQSVKFLVIQLYGAPLIYKRDIHWDRTIDFTPSSCIGQSSAMCLELPGRGHVPKVLKDFFFYKESSGKFSPEKGSTFSCNSDLVPIHGCIPGPALDVKFFRFVDPSRIDIAFIEHALEKLFNLRECCYEPSRLGQSLSASRVAVHVDRKDIKIIPDVEVKRNGIKYVFSDGIGKISSQFAQEVAKKCGFTSYTPSAFQIRYGGFKGVVAIDPNSSVKLSLRHSMLKYESDSTSLDILENSKYQSYFLNRQLITLLSTLGINDDVFERKQREAIAQLDAILTDPSRALEALGLMSSGESTNVLKEMLKCDYRPDAEPFLSLMLQTFRASSLQDLRTKARIFLPKGRAMMGTLDETGTLEYGQSRGNESGQRSVCKGKVVVAKNPCLHPGDMRVLKAVDVPALYHMVDCVVFPAKGKSFNPMDYNPGPPKVLHRDVMIEDVEEYFVDFIVNDTLGIISNAHVVFADKEPKKARSKQCLQLAQLSSIAVDFQKTGVAAEIPGELRVKKYPDFMDKPDHMTYQSERVMGRLYREVKGIAPPTATIKAFTKEVAMRSFDSDMLVNGFNKYVKEALYYKCEYDSRLSNLMKHYGIETEAEIVSGYIIKNGKMFS
ncbi:hypothetical protein Patl1_20784 [Pistacia atlantica]|uniref:Uncharacterized protein n=1 Tax=Pistacia atlantica TaxID=434234 RepID=A0ACC1BNP7_9ROSI|nr:hypothetical protein Patl1_20784 [Pistacia atlantica]